MAIIGSNAPGASTNAMAAGRGTILTINTTEEYSMKSVSVYATSSYASSAWSPGSRVGCSIYLHDSAGITFWRSYAGILLGNGSTRAAPLAWYTGTCEAGLAFPSGTRYPAGHFPTLLAGKTYYMSVVNETGTWDPSYFIPRYNAGAAPDFGWGNVNTSWNWGASVPFPPNRVNLDWMFSCYGTADIVSTGPSEKLEGKTNIGRLEYTSWANIASVK